MIETEKLLGDFYVVDLYIPHINTVIEVNGPHHFNARGLIKKQQIKADILKKIGYKLVQIPLGPYRH